jgi:hypothetical protein
LSHPQAEWNMTKKLIESLRAEVEAQYQEALHAIEILENYMQQSSQVPGHPAAKGHPRLGRRVQVNQRKLVLDALRRNPGAGIELLASECGLDKQQVRGVLYAPKIAQLIKREITSDGLAKYTLIESESSN